MNLGYLFTIRGLIKAEDFSGHIRPSYGIITVQL